MATPTNARGRKLSNRKFDEIRKKYSETKEVAEKLRLCLCDQIPTLLEKNDVTLGVPIEARIKTLSSIEEKISRKSLSGGAFEGVTDLVGIRLILLFKRDLERMDCIIRETFQVISSERAENRLSDTQFGYLSNHYIIKIPKLWLQIPTYSQLGELAAEIQVRTLAQHIWAAASHKLQYKREASVPPPLRRAIHRVSALLETVDLEFSRVLEERENYLEGSLGRSSNEKLNIDLLEKIISEAWPIENAADGDDFNGLLNNLTYLNVNTSNELEDIICKHQNQVITYEKNHVENLNPDDYEDLDVDRYDRGVFFTHVGLTRQALIYEFGKDKLWKAMGIS